MHVLAPPLAALLAIGLAAGCVTPVAHEPDPAVLATITPEQARIALRVLFTSPTSWDQSCRDFVAGETAFEYKMELFGSPPDGSIARGAYRESPTIEEYNGTYYVVVHTGYRDPGWPAVADAKQFADAMTILYRTSRALPTTR